MAISFPAVSIGETLFPESALKKGFGCAAGWSAQMECAGADRTREAKFWRAGEASRACIESAAPLSNGR